MDFTPEVLARCMPRAPRDACIAYAPAIQAAAVEFGITDTDEFVAALASISNESHLTRFHEASYVNTDYDYARNQVFGARMPPREVWEAWQAEGQVVFDLKMYNWLYDDRRPGNPQLGNVHDGDGFRRRGLGLLQITGGNNQKAVSEATGTDFYANPDLLLDPVQGSRAAFAYLKINNITKPAADGSEGGFLESVRRSNPGLPAKTFRTHHLVRWHEVRLGLHLEDDGRHAARDLQAELFIAGFNVGTRDGVVGAMTRAAAQAAGRAVAA